MGRYSRWSSLLVCEQSRSSSHQRTVGPSPDRAFAMAADAASWTVKTSLASIRRRAALAERPNAIGEVFLGGRAYAVAVVLDHEDDRQPFLEGERRGLVKLSFANGGVSHGCRRPRGPSLHLAPHAAPAAGIHCEAVGVATEKILRKVVAVVAGHLASAAAAVLFSVIGQRQVVVRDSPRARMSARSR